MTHTNAMDVILCRNVLMYFTPTQIRKVVGKFHRALLDGGWLAVSPCETSQELFAPLVTRNFPGVILYQKDDVQFHARQLSSSSLDEATDFVLPAARADFGAGNRDFPIAGSLVTCGRARTVAHAIRTGGGVL